MRVFQRQCAARLRMGDLDPVRSRQGGCRGKGNKRERSKQTAAQKGMIARLGITLGRLGVALRADVENEVLSAASAVVRVRAS